jgi:SAM-dependent methyltransferase
LNELAQGYTSPFSSSAEFYDALYSAERNYSAQARQIFEIIRTKLPSAKSVLDVACGTGLHLRYLSMFFDCEGLDASEAMLTIAKQQAPRARFLLGDMQEFQAGRKYDALLCLFSSITYAGDVFGLRRTLKNFATHLVPNGVCIIEPFVAFEDWVDRPTGTMRGIDVPELTVALVDRARRTNRRVVRDMMYAVATPTLMACIRERHEFGLFTRREYEQAFRTAGFKTERLAGFDPLRGLYVGQLAGGTTSATQTPTPN